MPARQDYGGEGVNPGDILAAIQEPPEAGSSAEAPAGTPDTSASGEVHPFLVYLNGIQRPSGQLVGPNGTTYSPETSQDDEMPTGTQSGEISRFRSIVAVLGVGVLALAGGAVGIEKSTKDTECVTAPYETSSWLTAVALSDGFDNRGRRATLPAISVELDAEAARQGGFEVGAEVEACHTAGMLARQWPDGGTLTIEQAEVDVPDGDN